MPNDYTQSQKNIKLKFEKTANLTNISSLADGRYKKKSSEIDPEKKKSSQSGRNNPSGKNQFSMTTGGSSKI